MSTVYVWVIVVWDRHTLTPSVEVFADEDLVLQRREDLLDAEFTTEDIFVRRFALSVVPEVYDVQPIEQTWTPEGV